MKAYWTIDQGKRDEAGRRVSAVRAIFERLRQYAQSKGGRFLLYGSTARGETGFDSDIDLLLDFPADLEADAWRFVEEVCAAHGMEADIKPLAWCTPQFAAQVTMQAVVLG
jgi:predicted nucleotidyltransferase